MTTSVIGKVVAVALGVPLLMPGPVFGQGALPIVCRGGGGMVGTVSTDGAMYITLSRAPLGAAVSPPGEGECSLVDRALADIELSVLLYQGDSAGLHFLLDAMLGTDAFLLNAINNNQGAMVVIGFGP